MNFPKPVVICGPSGVGKTTLIKMLLADFNDVIKFSISCTTRTPRLHEIEGKDYYFVSREEMQKQINNSEFLEYAEFSGNLYGTRKQDVTNISNSGKVCLLDIDIQGVIQLKQSNFEAIYIFIYPPSELILLERLRQRGTESEAVLHKRLARAKYELEYGELEGNFDYKIVNDNIEVAYNELKNCIVREIKKARHEN